MSLSFWKPNWDTHTRHFSGVLGNGILNKKCGIGDHDVTPEQEPVFMVTGEEFYEHCCGPRQQDTTCCFECLQKYEGK